MRTIGHKGFTMVELLIVIMIISILATLIIPGIIRAVELAKQAKCNTNVKVIVQGLKSYSSVSGDVPMVPTSNWDVAVGNNRNSRPFPEPGKADPPTRARNHSANMWLLVREGHVALEAFVCPATYDEVNDDNRPPTEYWDFTSAHRVSYGMQSPYGWDGSLSVLNDKDVALVADGSPYTRPYGVPSAGRIKARGDLKIVDWGGDTTEDKQLFGNSPNHNEGEGQNVGYNDGRVIWQPAANCGKDLDNIYTANQYQNDAKKARVETDPAGVLKSGVRNNPNDSLILP